MLYVGPGLTSHAQGSLCNATFQDFVMVTPPAITAQPAGATNVQGSPITLSVGATGQDLSYQWRRNGVNIASGTNSTLVLATPMNSDSGAYSVIVSNFMGQAVSADVQVLVLGFTTPPANQPVLCGSTAHFSCQVDPLSLGPVTPAFQWRLNGANLTGETNPDLYRLAAPGNLGPYTVVVTYSGYGTFTSTNAWILESTAPVITCPANMLVECGSPANFTVAASNLCGGAIAVACAPTSGSVLPVGTNTVNCVAQNLSGAQTNCSFTVTVVDTTSPAYTCPANITTTNTVVSWVTPVAIDICRGAVPVTCMPPPYSTFPVGTTTVHCQANDGINTNYCAFTVTVQSATPEIHLAVERQESGMLITWPASPSGFALQYSPSLGITTAADWKNHPGPFLTNSGTISTSVTITNTTLFYRLFKP
jgi:hypothetical protein